MYEMWFPSYPNASLNVERDICSIIDFGIRLHFLIINSPNSSVLGEGK